LINREEKEAAIVNVSSGLGFLPAVGMLIYSTTPCIFKLLLLQNMLL